MKDNPFSLIEGTGGKSPEFEEYEESLLNMGAVDSGNNEDIIDADYYLDLADRTDSKKQALKYAKKALELEPDNFDAKVMVAVLSSNNLEQISDKYNKLIEEEKELLKNEGFFDDENIGDFWGLFETRPFMNLLNEKVCVSIECGRFKEAVSTCEEMIRLCENDNLGVRYKLMHLYAALEDENKALELFKKYENDDTTLFLLPLAALYYKLNDLKKAAKYLRELKKTNDDTVAFFSSVVGGSVDDLIDEQDMSYGYRPYKIDEYIIAFGEYRFLYSISFVEWAALKLKTMK